MNTTLETTIIDTLPHGSGIDYTWNVGLTIDAETAQDDILTVAFTAHNSYHAMDNNGMYCGIVNFTVTGIAHLLYTGKVSLELVNVTTDEETIDAIMSEYDDTAEDEESNAPYLDDLDDYISETIAWIFSEYNKA